MKKTSKAASASAKVQEMLVSVVLDRSGSMGGNRDGTIDGYNEFLNGLTKDSETKFNVSLTQFDSPHQGPELTVSYTDRPLKDVPRLSRDTYEPRGGTPLFDAIGECVRRVDAKGRAVMVVIVTDGMENASREFNREQIKKLISEKEGEGWKFIFLAADIDAYGASQSIGVSMTNTAGYTKGRESQMYNTVALAAIDHSRNVRDHGMTRSTALMDTIGMSARASMGDMTVAGGRPAAPKNFPSGPGPKRPVQGEVPKTDSNRRTTWSVTTDGQ